MAKRATTIIGACGEHYVAAYLSGFDLIVALPRAGAPGCDLLVTDQRGGHAVRLQVKTGTQSTRNTKWAGEIYLWATSYAAIERSDKHLWYAYVWLKGWPRGDNLPEIYFVPSSVVSATMRKCQEESDKWPYFWFPASHAKKYEGRSGLQAILDGLEYKPTT